MKVFEGVYAGDSISTPPSTGDYIWDRGFRFLAWVGVWIILALVAYILWKTGGQALPAMTKYSLSFVTSSTWDLSKEQFGVLPEIWGTLYSSILASIIGGFFGVSIAIFLTQDFLAPRFGAQQYRALWLERTAFPPP